MPATSLEEPVQLCVQIEIRLLAPVEGGSGRGFLLFVQAEAYEHGFRHLDFVAGYNAVCLAEGTHDGKDGLDKAGLDTLELADQTALEVVEEKGTDCRTHQKTRKFAKGVTDQTANDDCKQH